MTRHSASLERTEPKRAAGEPDRVPWLGVITSAVVTVLIVLRLCQAPESSPMGWTLWYTFIGLLAGLLPVWGWMRGSLPLPRWGKIDLWVGLLCAGHLVAALLVVLGEGNKRTALNLMFEWAGVATMWVLLRTVCSIPEGRQVILRGLLAMLVAQGTLGIWQHHYGYTQLSQGYLKTRKELDRLEAIQPRTGNLQQSIQKLQQDLIRSGVQPHMLEGTGRIAFEARLLQSSEALGRCSLANTLAGLLLIGWVYFGGSLVSAIKSNRFGISFWLELCCWSAISYGLLLTKSRTGYVGVIVACGLLACFTLFRSVRSQKGRLGLIGGLFLMLTVVGIGGYLTGGIDRLVWEEAPKSLKYRMEYWQGALGVIGDAPLFGAGPGQFRQHYLKYKLPESSEEIVDPHNMILDAWSNGGLAGLIGLIGIIGWVCWRGVKLIGGREEAATDTINGGDVDPVWNQMAWILGLVGLLTLYVINGGGDLELLEVGTLWFVLMLAGQYWLKFQNEHQQAALGIIALIGIGVHLLGNGGIGMPTALISFLVLLAIAVPTQVADSVPAKQKLRILIAWPVAWATASLLLAALPVTNAALWTESAEFARTPDNRLAALRQAAQADRISPDGWGDLSVALTEQWMMQPTQRGSTYNQALEAAQEAVKRDPLNGVRYRQLGSLQWYRARVEKNPEFAIPAAEGFEQAISRSPTRADLLADAAEVLDLAGKAERSRELAHRALFLDELNHQAGHSDKYLVPQQVDRMKQLSASRNLPEGDLEK